MVQEITVTEYAEFLGVSKPAITYRIQNKKELPGVSSHRFDIPTKKFMLMFNRSTKKEDALKYFQELSNFQKHKKKKK